MNTCSENNKNKEDNENKILQNLKDVKTSCDICKNNIDKLYSILKENKDLNYKSLEHSLLKNLSQIEKNLANIQYIIEAFPNETSIYTYNNTQDTEELLEGDFIENTLIISKVKEKVFLPYMINDLKFLMKEYPDRYSNYKEIIDDLYTIPYNAFQNFPLSRFREAFKLVKDIEKKSLAEAIDLGTELLFKSNLHPAIIAGCRNIDELDIYLDCLDNNETDDFHCFNIKFEIPPIAQI